MLKRLLCLSALPLAACNEAPPPAPAARLAVEVRDHCHDAVRRAIRGVEVTIPDSLEVTPSSRGDTVLVAGAASWNADGKQHQLGWTCDMVRESSGKWVQWHFGLEGPSGG